MEFELNNKIYNVLVVKKNNKNTYLRIDDELNIVVTTNFFTTKKMIQIILKNNSKQILKMIEKKENEINKNSEFYYLGKKYNVVYTNLDDINIDGNYIYAKKDKLDKWYKNQMKNLFSERLKYNYDLFEENIPFPSLRIRTMKTRWGVCNIKTKTVTLNSLLLKYSVDKLDYVIVHELSHLVHANHSKEFWNLVSKYCPEYKKIRKELKE